MRMRNAPLKAFVLTDKKDRKQPTYEGTDEYRKVKDIPKKEMDNRVGGSKLKDLRSNDKNVDLDKGKNMPAKRGGFGPRANKNLGNMMTRQPEDTAE